MKDQVIGLLKQSDLFVWKGAIDIGLFDCLVDFDDHSWCIDVVTESFVNSCPENFEE